MKKINYLLAVTMITATIFNSCASKKATVKQQGETLIESHCSGEKYFSDKSTFRGNSIGESMDQSVAKKKAFANAKNELAQMISSTMKIVGDNFVSSTEFNNKEELTETFNEMARTVVNQELVGVVKICEKMTKTSEGRYKCYMAIELGAEKIASKYHERLSKDEKLKADYNYEKFKEEFNKEMEKMGQ